MPTKSNMTVSRRKNRSRKEKKVPANTLRLRRNLVTTVPKAATDTGNYRSVTIADFAGLADISPAFQEYRFKSITLKYECVTPNISSAFPTLYIAPQHFTTFLAPSNRDEMLQFNNLTVHQFAPGAPSYQRTFTPYTYLDTESGGRTFKASPWISCTSTNVKHFINVEWLTRYSTLDPNHTLDLTISAELEVRGTR
jgi:hypothetical protein